MPTSQNGYSANDRSVIATFTVPGATTRLALRKGGCSVILLDMAAWVDAHINPIDVGQLDDWGYAERKIRGSATTLSNHASGTAMDLDAVRHPLGRRGTWGADKAKIDQRMAIYDGVLRWGENYSGRPDGMHWEIVAGQAAVDRVVAKLRAMSGAPTAAPPGQRFPTVRQGSSGVAVSAIQKRLRIPIDGKFGPQTDRAVREFQRAAGLTVDGIVGANTYRAMGI